MPKRSWNLNTVYISERLQECLRPISRCALTTVVAPMGYGKTTAVNWYLAGRAKAEDAAIVRISNGEKRYDENGAMAASGRVSEALLAQLMRDPYLSRRPPKTLGRRHSRHRHRLHRADDRRSDPRFLRRASRAAHRRRGRQPQRHAHGGYRRGAPRRARAHERGSRL